MQVPQRVAVCDDAVMPDARPALVGLLAPMPSEMSPLARALSLSRAEGTRVYRGEAGAVELIGARTGIGTKRARDATARLLDAAPIEHILIVGIAGGMGTSKVGDVLFPEVVTLKDTRAEFRATPFGNISPRGRLVTHDDFDLGPDETQQLVDDGYVAVDMETAAVAEVCERRACPWTAVRAISDLVGVTPGDVIDLANEDGSPNIGASLRYLVTKPWRIPKLVRLGFDSQKAAAAAAQAAARAVRA
jgi:nucleoside phosphorylase